MADELYGLTQDDVALFKELVLAHKNGWLSVRQRSAPNEEQGTAPEVYIALTPVGGIPARSGTTPGFADCTIYRLLPNPSGTKVLTEAGAGFRTVYNLSATSIPSGEYIQTKRDKWGIWWVEGPVPSGSGDTCTPVSFSETDLRCEAQNLGSGTGIPSGTNPIGNLNLYRTVIFVHTDPATGCLTKEIGPESFIGTVDCCDLSCIPVDDLDCPCDGVRPIGDPVSSLISHPGTLLDGLHPDLTWGLFGPGYSAQFNTLGDQYVISVTVYCRTPPGSATKIWSAYITVGTLFGIPESGAVYVDACACDAETDAITFTFAPGMPGYHGSGIASLLLPTPDKPINLYINGGAGGCLGVCWPYAVGIPPYGTSLCLTVNTLGYTDCLEGHKIDLTWDGTVYAGGGFDTDDDSCGVEAKMICTDGKVYLFLYCKDTTTGEIKTILLELVAISYDLSIFHADFYGPFDLEGNQALQACGFIRSTVSAIVLSGTCDGGSGGACGITDGGLGTNAGCTSIAPPSTSFTLPAGNLLVVSAGCYDTGHDPRFDSITFNGHALTQAISQSPVAPNDLVQASIWYYKNTTGVDQSGVLSSVFHAGTTEGWFAAVKVISLVNGALAGSPSTYTTTSNTLNVTSAYPCSYSQACFVTRVASPAITFTGDFTDGGQGGNCAAPVGFQGAEAFYVNNTGSTVSKSVVAANLGVVAIGVGAVFI